MNTRNLQVPNNTPSFSMSSGACRVLSTHLIETSGTTSAIIYLRDSLTSSNDVITVISLAPGESARDYFGKHGLECESGVFLHVLNGSVRGNIQVVMEDEYQAWYERVQIYPGIREEAK